VTGPEISAIPKEARSHQGQSAGVVSRVVANTIDAAVVGVMVGGLYLGFVSVKFLLDPLSFTWPSGNLLASLTVALFLATFYLFLCWWLFGRSYGDHVMGLRVVGRGGRRLGPLRSLLRSAFCVFFPIGLFWCVISPERRSVQDVVLWTRVVYDWMPRPGASQRKTLLGEAPMAMEQSDAGEAAAAGERPAAEPPAAGEPPEGVPPEESHEPARRHRWSRPDDPDDD
jgi:uncharacterized RDD family membrane protein YckC